MADTLAVMRDGRFEQIDDPQRAYHAPTNRFVGEFLGRPSMNTAVADATPADGGVIVEFAGSTLGPVEVPDREPPAEVVLGIRPEALSVVEPGAGSFDATVREVEYQGSWNVLFLTAAGVELVARVGAAVRPAPGATIGVALDPSALVLFDPETGVALT